VRALLIASAAFALLPACGPRRVPWRHPASRSARLLEDEQPRVPHLAKLGEARSSPGAVMLCETLPLLDATLQDWGG
jgi:hypothetical protein